MSNKFLLGRRKHGRKKVNRRGRERRRRNEGREKNDTNLQEGVESLGEKRKIALKTSGGVRDA